MMPTESFRENKSLFSFLRKPDWNRYVSTIKKGTFAQNVSDNPLLIVHPGMAKFHKTGHELLSGRWQEYQQYLDNLVHTYHEAMAENRSALVFCHTDSLDKTLTLIPPTSKLLLVPTITHLIDHPYYGPIPVRGIQIDTKLLGVMKTDSFYQQLAETISRASIVGEFGNEDSCLGGIEQGLKRLGVKINRVEKSIFSRLPF